MPLVCNKEMSKIDEKSMKTANIAGENLHIF